MFTFRAAAPCEAETIFSLAGRAGAKRKHGQSLFVLSNNPVQRPARRRQGIDAPRDGRVLDQRRRVVRLDAGVDHQRPAAAPVLLHA